MPATFLSLFAFSLAISTRSTSSTFRQSTIPLLPLDASDSPSALFNLSLPSSSFSTGFSLGFGRASRLSTGRLLLRRKGRKSEEPIKKSRRTRRMRLLLLYSTRMLRRWRLRRQKLTLPRPRPRLPRLSGGESCQFQWSKRWTECWR